MTSTLKNFSERLNKYAELTIKVGANILPGDTALIQADVAQAEFVHLVAEQAYQAGAKKVIVKWSDDKLTRLNLQFMNDEDLNEITKAQEAEVSEWIDQKVKRINIFSSNPGAFEGIEPEKISEFQKSRGKLMHPIRVLSQNNDLSWTIVAVPSIEWAKIVFPDQSENDAIDSLWEQIFEITRINQPDPIKAWKEHETNLNSKAKILNEHQFKELHYTAPNTDLIIGLPKNHVWQAGGSKNAKNESFMPNIPTEEVFTGPDKNHIDGYISSTKPLSYAGKIINDMKFTFENGKITKIEARDGQEILEHLTQTDPGSTSLGEVALVPNSSPISKSGVIFFNTLFDENASNHLAIGSAYPFTVENGTKMNELELQKAGLNVSQVHVDFMVGSSEMDIDGISADGKITPIFRQGEWVI